MRDQSLLEEIANSVSHGLGLTTAVIGTPFLIYYAMQYENTSFIVATCVLVTSVLILYLSSTLYHAIPAGNTKDIFRIIDHSAIYLLIAETYTPSTVGVLKGVWGWSLLGAVWSIALIGIILKVIGKASHPILSTIL